MIGRPDFMNAATHPGLRKAPGRRRMPFAISEQKLSLREAAGQEQNRQETGSFPRPQDLAANCLGDKAQARRKRFCGAYRRQQGLGGRDLPVFCLASSWPGCARPCQRGKRMPLAPRSCERRPCGTEAGQQL
jgi:hypothetical protein